MKLKISTMVVTSIMATLVFAAEVNERSQVSCKDMIKIDYLKNHPEHILTCATWSFNEWGHHRPADPLEKFIESRKRYINDETLPLTLIAFDGEEPIGMCSLAPGREVLPHLMPWLASLYVAPAWRNKKIGSLLQAEICKKAAAMGFEKIYLFTSDSLMIPWYEKFNWRVAGVEWLRDHNVTIMEKDL